MTGDTLKTQLTMNVYHVLLEPTLTLSMPHHVLLVHQDTPHPKKEATKVHSVQVEILTLSFFKSYVLYNALTKYQHFAFQIVTMGTLEIPQAMNVYPVQLDPTLTLSMLHHVLIVH